MCSGLADPGVMCQVSELSELSASAVEEVRVQVDREKARTVALEEVSLVA
jgi:hypothetical protein